MSIEDSLRLMVREEVRAAVREELRAALSESKQPAEAGPALLTVEQVAERAGGVRPSTVREWIRSGRLEARRAGHRFLITPRALEAFLAASSAPEKEPIGAEDHLGLLLHRIGEKPTR